MVISKGKLTSSEREHVAATLAEAQRRSGANLALVVVSCSDRYSLFPVVWAALSSLGMTAMLAIAQPHLSLARGVLLNLSVFMLLLITFDWRPLRLLLVPPLVKQNHARQLAHRMFAAHILANAEHKPGLLLFVSLGERCVEIVADRNINNRVSEGTWEKIACDFTDKMRAERLPEALVNMVEACSNVLS